MRLPTAAVLRIMTPAGARCRGTGPPGAARRSVSLLCKGVTRSGEGPLLRAPLAQLLKHNMPSRRLRAVRACCPSCSTKASIALPHDDLDLAHAIVELNGMECSMAACLHGIGVATACDPSRLERQSQSQRLRTDGFGLLRCRLSRPSTIARR